MLYNTNTIQRDSQRRGCLSGKRKQRLYDATVPNTEQTIRSVYDYETNCHYDTKELDYDKQRLLIEYVFIHPEKQKTMDFESEKLL
jgi:hypothetical protein